MTQQCTATAKSTGERCQNDAIKGGNVCYQHGGAASQVQEKAQERLDKMADSVTADMQAVIQDLVDVYNEADDEEKAEIARELRQNWKAILDRTGHGPSETREVTGDDGGALEVSLTREVVGDDDGD
jgi:excinuclease UvrABC nuclease subunit